MNFEAFLSAADRDKDGLCFENSSENLQKSLATSFADAAIPSEAGLRTTLLANDPIRHLKILTGIDYRQIGVGEDTLVYNQMETLTGMEMAIMNWRSIFRDLRKRM